MSEQVGNEMLYSAVQVNPITMYRAMNIHVAVLANLDFTGELIEFFKLSRPLCIATRNPGYVKNTNLELIMPMKWSRITNPPPTMMDVKMSGSLFSLREFTDAINIDIQPM